MVNPKELNIIVEPNRKYLCLAYNLISGNIKIPRLKGLTDFYERPPESLINFHYFIRCLNHEILHKYIHENIGYEACKELDNLDIRIDALGRSFTGLIS